VRLWGSILALVVTASTLKAAGPVALGSRRLRPALARLVESLAPALLTALVVVALLGEQGRAPDIARVAGVVVAVVLFLRRAPLLLCVVTATIVTALVRAVGG
jgi:branched-subunit amino acid transport protein